MSRVPPSLEDLCLQKVIDNLNVVGDVGDTNFELLKVILAHCTTDQLRRIENSTEKDLTPVTDELWKKCYGRDFGAMHLELVEKKLKSANAKARWRQLYDAKLKTRQEKEKQGVELFQKLCKEENDKKQSRQTRMCSKVPPPPKRGWGSSGSTGAFSHVKGRLMKKARVEHAASREARMVAAIRNKHKR